MASMPGLLVRGEEIPAKLEALTEPHIASFNYFVGDGLHDVIALMEPFEIIHPVTNDTHRFWFENPTVGRPCHENVGGVQDPRLFPRDCREGGLTYKAPIGIDFCYQAGNGTPQRFTKRLGGLPIMVKSSPCYLNGMTRSKLIRAKEESNELGGYFICNGIERIVRLLIQQRRHYVMALRRSAFKKRGSNYTNVAVLCRCVRTDQSSGTVRLHLLTDDSVNVAFTLRRAEYFIPVGMLFKCFLEMSDVEIYDKIVAGAQPGTAHAAYLSSRAGLVVLQANQPGLRTRAACLEHLGRHFRIVLDQPARKSDYDVGVYLMRNHVFVHLDAQADKFQLLMHMLHKLFALASGSISEDNADALTNHEILMPGHLLLRFYAEKLGDCVMAFKEQVKVDMSKDAAAVNLESGEYIKKCCMRMPDIGLKFEYLLNTGNLVSRGGMDLSQASGFTVVAEKLNFFRYLSHFRSVHRGAYFATMRTTTVRKLLPESWGFMCPVHTPDGSPCGLLMHLAANCRVVASGPLSPEDTEAAIAQVLSSLGMVPSTPMLTGPTPPAYLTVMLDGKVLGWLRSGEVARVLDRLRELKVAVLALEEGAADDATPVQLVGPELLIPSHMEVVHLPILEGGTFPGVFLYTQSSRVVRPVRHLRSGGVELIGSLEQHNMHVQCPDGGYGGSSGLRFTHRELHAGAMLSVVASLTPFSDYNQSPRNMYQCQMAKQTMGTPGQAIQNRADNKTYRIQNPQSPLARTQVYSDYCMDEMPNGTNAVVAVIAYTGYDMEDAMILNKSSVERGLAHASIYKMEIVDFRKDPSNHGTFAAEPQGDRKAASKPRPVGAFGQQFPQVIDSAPGSSTVKDRGVLPPGSHRDAQQVDRDGLPHVGMPVWPQQTYYCEKNTVVGKYKKHALKGEEIGYVDKVTILGTPKDKNNTMQRAAIQMRYNRNPMVGDKFASRHGQKGVLSILWPDEDMPYCAATGMRPDLLINPHAFPSRMTIGMLVESMASKAGALTGTFVDATPFARSDGKPANPVAEFGGMLEKAGYARLGQETMISGVTGEEMAVDIFIGLVYYQRLRHMVADKFQVRSTGPVNNLTRQPIKGRKFGGGIRFGEMERDSLLAHGAAYLLHDRLHACSDYHVLDVCTGCGSVLSPLSRPYAAAGATHSMRLPAAAAADAGVRLRGGAGVAAAAAGTMICPVCDGGAPHNIERLAVPYVFKYLAAELACMNIKMRVALE